MDRYRLFNAQPVEQTNFPRETGDVLTAPRVWQEVLRVLMTRMPEAEFQRWIGELRLVAEYDGDIIIAARDPVAYDRVSSQHLRAIQRLWSSIDPLARMLRLVCWRNAPASLRALAGDPWAEAATAAPARPAGDDDEQRPAPGSGREMTFETLVIGPSNEIAATLARRIALGQPAGTPVTMIYGPQGTGKTHLMHALRALARTHDSSRSVLYITAEEFMSSYHDGVKQRDTSGLKRRLRAAGVLIVDDLHRIAGKPGTETELNNNIREVAAAGGQVVLVGDVAPGETTGFSARMRAEIKGATAVEIGLPDETMRREILTRLAADITATHPAFVLSDDMIRRLNAGIRGPGRELTGAIWSLYTEANFGDRPVTMDMVDKVIRRHSGELKEPSIDIVKRAALRVFPISKSDLEGPSKARAYVYPRQIAMWLCRQRTGKSLPQIGWAFGKRDHTSVLYAVRRVGALAEQDPQLAADITRVEAALDDLLASGQT